jgi:hypothetical protein
LLFVFVTMAAADDTLAEFVASVEYEGKDASWDEWVVESLKLNDIMVRLLGWPVHVALCVGCRCSLTLAIS